MIAPLKMFSLREYGTSHQPGHVCSSCHEGRLVPSPRCPVCLEDSVHVDDHDRCHCAVCGNEWLLTGTSRLVCDHCGTHETGGWRRNVYAAEVPSQFQDLVNKGELYTSVQQYAKRPVGEDPFHLADFYLDIDRPELEDSLQAVVDYAKYLEERGVYFHLYFSGSKGFHVQIPWQVIGAQPSKHLHPERYKSFARALQLEVGQPVDLKIYSRRRMIRSDNSMHGKTGLYKVPLTLREIRAMGTGIPALATTPRVGSIQPGGTQMYVVRNEPLAELYAQSESFKPPEALKTPSVRVGMMSQDNPVPCVRDALEQGAPGPGTRHELTLNMAAYWAANDLPESELVHWAETVPGVSSTRPYQRVDDVKNSLNWSRRKNPAFRCSTMKAMGFCHPECPFYVEPH